MNIKTLFSGMLLMAATSASAQYVHIKLTDGTKYDIDSKTIESMIVDNEKPGIKPGDKVEGTATVGDKTYTLTVGGTVADYVDLGLSVKWATHNIGASQPEEYGAYLAWGEVGAEEEGYVNGVKMKNGSSYYYWDNLKYSEGISYQGPFSKYVYSSSYGTVDKKTVLEAMDDAATVNWGSDWRMPTRAEQDELRNNCTWEWVTTDVKDSYGNYVKGYKVTGPNGNSLFLPSAGYRGSGSLYDVGSDGHYWSSSLYTSYSSNAYGLYFDSGDVGWGSSGRYYGPSVRAVRP